MWYQLYAALRATAAIPGIRSPKTSPVSTSHLRPESRSSIPTLNRCRTMIRSINQPTGPYLRV